MNRFLLALLGLLSVSVAGAAEPVIFEGKKSLPLPGESFQLDGHDAFVILPPNADSKVPWVWYAPTLAGLPSQAEVWMFEQFLAKGIAIAGIDIGESFGSPLGRETYNAFYEYLVRQRHFRSQPCLLARSRGGLMLYNWAVEHPQSVAGVAGIYPVCDIASYPGIAQAAGAYSMSATQLEDTLPQHNPIDRLGPLANAGVPIFHIHGDDDNVVPLPENSAELARRYKALQGPVEVKVIAGQGHNMWPGWFQSQKLTDFAIARALGHPFQEHETIAELPPPIAHWQFDDEGNIAKDSAGSHHGKIVGARSAAGKVGKSLEFTRAQGDHVVIAYAEDLALSTFTVSAWVYLTREPTFSGILGTRHDGEHTFDMKVNTAKVHGDIGDGKDWIETAVNIYADEIGTNGVGGDLALNRWYHIAYVIDDAAQKCRLYIDADLKKIVPFKGSPVLMTKDNEMHIGHSSETEFMDGRIDEVKIWNQALTTAHIQSDWSGQR